MKTIFKKLKKGFTIVELVIVIAVIAILAAVLIPTLANLVDSANESNDMVLVSNLNKIVAAYDTVGEIETVNDALDGALENGYSVSNLTPTSEGNVIVYDSVSNRFALLTANALTTTNPDDDDIIYKDTSTTKTDWTDYTTWVFVDASATTNGYVTITTSGETYTLSGTNSYILTGTDWNGRSVIANYGLVLFDNTKSVTLNTVTISNNKSGLKADTNSSTKNAISKKTIDNTSSSISIVVNVKAIYLVCTAENYAINSYSTISGLTTVKNCQFNEHGTTLQYDLTSIGSGKVTNYNSDISADIVINLATDAKIDDVFADNTNTVNTANIYTTNITYSADGTIQLGTISYTSTGVAETKTIEIDQVTDTNGSIILQLGTEKYPYLISDFSTYAEIAYARCGAEEGDIYFKLQNNVYITERVRMVSNFYNSGNVAEDLACNIHFDLSSYNVYFVSNVNCNENFIYDDQSTGSYIIGNGSFYAVDINYTSLDSGMRCFIFNRCSAEFTNCNFDMVAFDFTLQDSDITILFDTCNITYRQTENTEDTALMTINDNRFNDEKASIIFNNVNIKVASYYSIVLYTYDEETLLMSFTKVTFNNTIVERIYDMSGENEIYASLIYTDSYSADYFGQDICQRCTFTVGNVAVDIYGNTIEN